MTPNDNRAESRAARLHRVEEILYNAPPAGLGMNEIATRCGVNRSTIWKDIRALVANEVPIWDSGDGHYGILRERYITSVRLNIHEATALFLATRLLTRYSDTNHPHVARAIEKLAAAMPKDFMQNHIRLAAEVVRTRRDQPELTRVLEGLTEAWADRKQVRLWQKSKEGEPARARLFDPYFIEPSGVGYALYVIGWDHFRNDLRTFKIDRLARVEVTGERFTPSADFDPYRYLHNAWGINWGSGEAIEVCLQFPPGRVADRVRESEWHYSQKLENLPEGGCVLTVTVGSTLEMKPFIRQWGADCVVLAPPDLRREIAEEMRQAAQNYAEEVGAK